ncbi:hypothetical protein BH683_001575 [Williamsia sp. 1138]|nr:hypothetical protein BH683_001575 [Williamsia sp. 1138]
MPRGGTLTEVSVLGVRHHGPGSARGVLAELDRIDPDIILIEGPADADPLVGFVGAADMTPPVAILAYAVDRPAVAAFWPFAAFSPEWQAMRWANESDVPVRFCDLPAAMVLAHGLRGDQDATETSDEDPTLDLAEPDGLDASAPVRTDPIGVLADAAGYDDPERWWDDVIETRSDGGGFEAIAEAMAALRDELPPVGDQGDRLHEQRREAQMRQVLRKAIKEPGVERVVVVCGAWHAPALMGKLPPATGDAKLLRGTPKVRVKLAWVPWTHSRLAFASGYGAGVLSPGWYHHLFTQPQEVITRWLIKVARLLRDKDIAISSAHVIESARLAEALATLRHRPLPGLAEVTEATEAVMCDGDDSVMALINDELVIGELLGSTPADAPTVPLEADLRASARSARLKIDPMVRQLVLDLRKPSDLSKSVLLHRLASLDIDWGVPEDVTGSGTFKEGWRLAWKPDFAIDIVVAAVWGTTVEAAATSRLIDRATTATRLAQVTAVLEQALLADLPDAVSRVLGALRDRAAIDRDVEHLMNALPALSRALRYGDVRGTDTRALAEVTTSLLVRVCAGLPAAVTGLGAEAAAEFRKLIDQVQEVTDLLEQVGIAGEEAATWREVLRALADRRDLHGALVGRIVRILLDSREIDADDAATRLHRALSVGAVPADKAAWIDGFIGGGGLLLVHDRSLLAVIDHWLAGLPDEQFTELVPLLRRTFSLFEAGIRRNIAESVKGIGGGVIAVAAPSQIDAERAAPAVAVVASLLGLLPAAEGSADA